MISFRNFKAYFDYYQESIVEDKKNLTKCNRNFQDNEFLCVMLAKQIYIHEGIAYIKITWAWHKYIKYLIEMQIFRSRLMSSCYKIHELYESVSITSPNLIG